MEICKVGVLEKIEMTGSLRFFKGFRQVSPSNLSFYVVMIFNLLQCICKNRKNRFGKDLAQKTCEILGKAQGIGHCSAVSQYIEYCKGLIGHVLAEDAEVDFVNFLDSDERVASYLVYAMWAIYSVTSEVSEKIEIISTQNKHLEIQKLADGLEVNIMILQGNTLKKEIFCGNSELLITVWEIQEYVFTILDVEESRKIGKFPYRIEKKAGDVILGEMFECLGKVMKKSKKKDVFVRILQELQGLEEENPCIQVEKWEETPCAHTDQVIYTLDCGHSQCIKCIFQKISSKSPMFCEYSCAISPFDSNKLLQKYADFYKITSFPLQQIPFPPLHNNPPSNPIKTFENTAQCAYCKQPHPNPYFHMAQCQNNCQICLCCKILSTETCKICLIPLKAEVKAFLKNLLNSDFAQKFDAKSNFLCMSCAKIKALTQISERCRKSCFVCKNCAFPCKNCQICGIQYEQTRVNCVRCEKFIEKIEDLAVYEECGHEIHNSCRSSNKKSCLICLKIRGLSK